MTTIYSNNETVNINPADDLVLYKEEFINSRIEKFLYAICALDFDDLPTPLSRIEELYKCLATGLPAPTFVPQSRVEKYLMAILGGYDTNALPAPQSRTEVLLNKILLGDTDLSDIEWLKSRYEFLLAYIAKSGETSSGPDVSYVNYSLNDALTTLYDTVEYPVRSATLKGTTIKNLHKKFTTSGVVEIAEEVAKLTNSSHMLVCNTQEPLANNTQYLIKVEILNNTASRLIISWRTSSLGHLGNITHNLNGVKGIHEIVVTTPANGVIEAISFKNESSDGEISFALKCVIIPYQVGLGNVPFFDGLCSVKMPVLTTTGKNLFDINKFKGVGIDAQGYYIPTRFVDNGEYTTLKLKPNTAYVLKGTYVYTGTSSFCYRIKDNGSYRNLNVTFTTDATGVIDIKIGSNNYDVSNPNKAEKIMLVEVALKDIYEPYKTNILTCNEEVILRSNGANTYDELNLFTGELIQRIGTYTFTGDEPWFADGPANGPKYFLLRERYIKPQVLGGTSGVNLPIICNRLPTIKYSEFTMDNGGINFTYDLRVNFTNCNCNQGATAEDLKAYLKANPTTIYYPISESVKTVDLSTLDQDGKETELNTFDDVTHVMVSSEGLVPTGEIDIARPIQFVDYSLDNGLTTLYNTLEYPVKSAILKGQTLVNLVSQCEVNLSNTSKIETGFKFNATAGSSDQKMGFLNIAKPNTYYTYIFTSDTAFEYYTGWDATNGGGWNQPTHQAVVGLNVLRVKTEVNTTKTALVFRTKANLVGNKDVYLTNFMILEGDYTNVDIPYFTGMQSVKMPVLTTTGKNLFDDDTIFKQGYLNYTTGKFNVSSNATDMITDYIPFSSKGEFVVSYDGDNRVDIVCYDNDKNYINGAAGNGSVINITENTAYIIVMVRNIADTKNRVQIERGTVPTPFEPYKTNILTVNEEVELRGIGEVRDELNLTTGELTQRVGEIVLDGDENWNSYGSQSNQVNTVAFKLSHTNHVSSWGTGFGCCDKLPFTNGDVVYGQDLEGVTTDANNIVVRVNKSKASSIDEFKAWLSNNNIRVVYPLKEEVIKTVDLSTLDQDGKETELSTFDDVTHVTVSSEGLVPTGEITIATKNATDVIDASFMSLRMDDISNSQRTLEESANAQSDDIDVTMLGTTDIYEQLL